MELRKRLIVSAAFSMIIFILTFITTIVPCQISPSVPNPDFAWQSCTFNPDLKLGLQFNVQYFGLTDSLMDAYLILLFGLFAISFIILTLINSRKRR